MCHGAMKELGNDAFRQTINGIHILSYSVAWSIQTDREVQTIGQYNNVIVTDREMQTIDQYNVIVTDSEMQTIGQYNVC